MKQFLTLVAAILFTTVIFAQNTGKVSGIIKDGGDQKIIDAATISLLRSKDSSIAKVALSDKDGRFVFENIKEGAYLVLATSIGHSRVYSDIFLLNDADNSVDVGVLQLLAVENNLKEVTVTAKKQ